MSEPAGPAASRFRTSSWGSICVFAGRQCGSGWKSSRNSDLRPMQPTTTLPATQNPLSGPTKGGKLARKRKFQYGSLFQRGKRNKVWVARWWEQTIDSKGKELRVRRSETLGTVA